MACFRCIVWKVCFIKADSVEREGSTGLYDNKTWDWEGIEAVKITIHAHPSQESDILKTRQRN